MIVAGLGVRQLVPSAATSEELGVSRLRASKAWRGDDRTGYAAAMQWEPQKPASQRAHLVAIAIVVVPVTLLVIGTLVLLWQVLGQATAQ
jgi:hypothetical protein